MTHTQILRLLDRASICQAPNLAPIFRADSREKTGRSCAHALRIILNRPVDFDWFMVMAAGSVLRKQPSFLTEEEGSGSEEGTGSWATPGLDIHSRN